MTPLAPPQPFTGSRKDSDTVGTIPSLAPGQYGKDPSGAWYARVPFSKVNEDSKAPMGAYFDHGIAEHADGTITVSPSVEFEPHFHGWLRRGVWSW